MLQYFLRAFTSFWFLSITMWYSNYLFTVENSNPGILCFAHSYMSSKWQNVDQNPRPLTLKTGVSFFFKHLLKIFFIDYAITVVPFFLPITPLHPAPPLPPAFPPPQFMSMGRTYKFCAFSISYTVLNLLLSVLCLPIMLLIPYTFFPHSPSNPFPLITLHVISIFVNLFLFQLFAQFIFVFVFFRFHCGQL